MASRRYEQLGASKITKNRNVVISSCDNGGFTLAQQLEVAEKNGPTKVFLKGAIFFEDLSRLIDFKNVLDDVITMLSETDSIDWDEVTPDASDTITSDDLKNDDGEIDVSDDDDSSDDDDWAD